MGFWPELQCCVNRNPGSRNSRQLASERDRPQGWKVDRVSYAHAGLTLPGCIPFPRAVWTAQPHRHGLLMWYRLYLLSL